MKYERFDGYWQKGKPYLDGVETHYIKDKMTAVAALRAKEVHVLCETPTKHANELKKEGFVIVKDPAGLRSLVGDSANKESVFADKRVREAVEYAVNRKAITDTLGYGFWEPANQNSPSKCNGYNPDLTGRPYNPEKARQLLKEAGYPNGFKTKLMSSVNDATRDTMAAIQRDLKKVGIDAEIEFQDSGKYFFTLIKGWKNGLLFFGNRTPVNLTQQFNSLYKDQSARLPNLFRPRELQEVLTKAETVPDYETQSSLVKKSVKLISDNAVMSPLWAYADVYVAHKTLRDPGFGKGARGQWSPADAWLSE